MMSNVIAFPMPKSAQPRTMTGAAGPVTLFIHVKRVTLIAHLTGRVAAAPAKNGRASKN